MQLKKRISKLIVLFLVLALMCPALVFADQTVYTTATGSKYHSTSSCSGLSNAKNVYTNSESDAISKGLAKCSICWDGSSGSAGSSSGSSAITTTVVTTHVAQASGAVKLKAPAKKVKIGKKLKVKLLNNKSKVKWSLSNKRAKVVKKKASYAVIKGVKKGTVTLKAKVGSKTYKIKIKVVK